MSVSLRKLIADDADEMFAAVRESIQEVSRWMPWCGPTYSLDDARRWIETSNAAHVAGTMHDFAIIDADNRYAGSCSINAIQVFDGFANLAYWIRTSRTGRGIAPEAVRQLAAWTFANTRLNRVELVIAIDNLRSQRVAEKAGAEREGVLKKRVTVRGAASDAMMYSIVRPDD